MDPPRQQAGRVRYYKSIFGIACLRAPAVDCMAYTIAWRRCGHVSRSVLLGIQLFTSLSSSVIPVHMDSMRVVSK